MVVSKSEGESCCGQRRESQAEACATGDVSVVLRIVLGWTRCYARSMAFYRRNLPHWHPEKNCIFFTWRLYRSLPAGFLRRLRVNANLAQQEEFRAAEKFLDRPAEGPLWLKEPRVADIVVGALYRGAFEIRRYDLHSYSVMANHLHVLLTPLARIRNITREIKGATARAANLQLGRTGAPFWQDESFDHWIRSEAQFIRVKNYIERNPVKAGLVSKPEDWPWSSASPNARVSSTRPESLVR
jgi:putative transposase